MSSNSTSTDTGVSTSATSSQAASTPTTSSVVESSSSSIANSSPATTATPTDSATSSIASTSTPVSVSSTSSQQQTSTSNPPSSTTSSNPPSSTSNTPSSTSNTPSTTTSQPGSTTSDRPTSASLTTIVQTSTNAAGSTVTVFQTSTANDNTATHTGTATSSSTSGASTAGLQTGSKSTSSGLSSGGVIAVAVVVPIVAVALIVLAGLYFWRKRKARKDAEELRRKEVEEYGYNPNNDPTLPAVGGQGSPDGAYEMREEGSSGYRGWGTTAVASSGRKASTTLSGGQSPGGIGMAYSEGTSPTHGPVSDTRSDNPLMDGRPQSGEAESLGAMGPAASGNRSDINRGPSNASSSYSAANRSDGSGEIPGSYGAGQYYNGTNQYDTGNPYSPETQFGSPPGRAEMGGQPVIRDVQARRNTRIENPAHFPQQSAGISQNF